MVKATAKKTVKKVAAKPAKKSAPAKKTLAKKGAVKKGVAKKVAVKKPIAKKIAPVKKVAKKAAVTKLIPLSVTPANKRPAGMPEQFLAATLKILDERKAENIVTIDLSKTGRSSMADYVVIATGQASRQIAAIAQYLQDAYFELGNRNIRMEGLQEGNWVLVDAGDVIVHLFRPEVREYYNLESMWEKNSLNAKRGARARG